MSFNEDITRAKDRQNFQSLYRHQADISRALFLGAGIYGIVSVALHAPQFGQPVEVVTLAMNIAAHGSIANPFFVLPTGPTAVIPPLYPLMLALLIRILRSLDLVYPVAVVGTILANAATAALLPRLSFVFYRTLVPGVLASLLWIPAMPIIPSYDASYTVLGTIIFCLTVSEASARNKGSLSLVSGLLAGLIYLLNPATVLIIVPWLAFVCWRTGPGGKHRISSAAVTFVILVVFICAWGLRNYLRLGAFGSRTALGMALYVSNNDCAEVDMFRDQLSGCYDARHPNTSLEEAMLLRDLGEVKYDEMRIADVKRWVRNNPRRFASLTTKRLIAFWFPVTMPAPAEIQRARGSVPDAIKGWIIHRNQVAYAVRLITALSIPGLILMLCRREEVSVYVVSVMSVFPLLYYVVVSDVRFRYPIMWLSLLLAGYFLAWIMRLVMGCRERSNLPPSHHST